LLYSAIFYRIISADYVDKFNADVVDITIFCLNLLTNCQHTFNSYSLGVNEGDRVNPRMFSPENWMHNDTNNELIRTNSIYNRTNICSCEWRDSIAEINLDKLRNNSVRKVHGKDRFVNDVEIESNKQLMVNIL